MIPFIDLKAQYARIKDRVDAAMHAVLDHGRYVMGPEITELEAKLAEFTGTGHCLSCSSGTDALLMGLMAKGVGPGHAVFTSPFTFIATAEVISLLGATPVFVDIDPATFNMDLGRLALAIQAVQENNPSLHPLPDSGQPLEAKGIIGVDLFGLCLDYERVNSLARDKGLFVIEDAAQSFGARIRDQRACSLAEIGCTSFFPAKPLGCYGDGGAVFTDSEELHGIMDSIRVHGQGADRYTNERIGINGRMDSLQAAVLLAKLEVFEQELEQRQRVAKGYAERLAGLKNVTTPDIPEDCYSAWAQYSVRCPDRDRVRQALQDRGIPTAVYYPIPLHLQQAFAPLGHKAGDMPVAEQCAGDIFSLPMHPYLQDDDLDAICKAIAEAL